MEKLTTVAALVDSVGAWRAQGLRIGLVPTMGGLHPGHTSLMDIAREQCDRLVVSVFVNPLQFGEGEDLAVYPRNLEADAEKCRAHGVDLLFAPEDFYPANFSTRIVPSGVIMGAVRYWLMVSLLAKMLPELFAPSR